MKLLDLFCGAGGCSVGYQQAGFDHIVGVDINAQLRYPFEFIQTDVMTLEIEFLRQFDLIHASPPCQAYSVTKSLHDNEHPDLVAPVRAMLIESGRPYVIENVPGSPVDGVKLCGTMFGLRVIRHRFFECNPPIWFSPNHCACENAFTHSGRGQFSSFENGATHITVAGHNFKVADAREAMGIDWMTQKEIAQAIPPAYTKWIGEQMLLEVAV